MKPVFGTLTVCLLSAGCSGLPSTCDNQADAGDPTFSCDGVPAVTLTQLQADVFTPSCALAGCHVATNTPAPTDYASVRVTAGNVGKASIYGGPLKVVDPNRLITSTMWLKVLGGSPGNGNTLGRFRASNCQDVGPAMPLGKGALLPDAQQQEIRGWICAGAPAQ